MDDQGAGPSRLQQAPGRDQSVEYFEHAPDGVLLVDGKGQVLEANPAATAMLGYGREELLAMTLWQTLDPSGVEAARAHFGAVTGAGGRALGDVPLRRKDGTTFIAEIHAVALPADRYLGFLRDVTAHRDAERTQMLYAQAFESSGEAVLISDAENRIVSVNPAFTAITGYTLDEVRGKNPRILASGRHAPLFYQAMWKSLSETGRWQGELWNRRKNGEVYPEWSTLSVVKHRGVVTNHVAVFSDLSARRAAEAEASYLAQYDALTQLANRALLQDRLAQAIGHARETSSMAALLYVDLDQFKTINDSLGHHAGDVFLQSVAGRLRRCVRAADTVARLGGDEFALVLPGIRAGHDAAQVARKILDGLQQPHVVAGHEITSGASIGIALFPQDGGDAQILARCADAAMYAAKSTGRNTFQFFTREMATQANERLEIESRLRRAVERGHLSLQYQPQVDLRTGKAVGVEALLRWTDPELGPVSPAKFIPVAEDSGVIVQVGEWVLRTAAEQCRTWIGSGLPRFSVAVNISAAQFRQRDFVSMVERVVSETGVDPRLLELEITEGVVMHDAVGAIRGLEALRALGLSVAMDDFGIGYSSLSFLKRFPIDRLKIDRSFVNDLTKDRDDQEIVRAVVALGHALELTVLAEGVETRAQLDHLQKEGCDQVQGWYYSRAVAPAEVPRFFEVDPEQWDGPKKAAGQTKT